MNAKLLFVVVLSLCTGISAIAQTAGQKIYCEVTCLSSVTKIIIYVDTGRGVEEEKVVGEDGKAKRFNSKVAVLNYMSSKGWQIEDTYFIPIASRPQKVHCLLMSYTLKEGENPDEIYTELTGKVIKGI